VNGSFEVDDSFMPPMASFSTSHFAREWAEREFFMPLISIVEQLERRATQETLTPLHWAIERGWADVAALRHHFSIPYDIALTKFLGVLISVSRGAALCLEGQARVNAKIAIAALESADLTKVFLLGSNREELTRHLYLREIFEHVRHAASLQRVEPSQIEVTDVLFTPLEGVGDQWEIIALLSEPLPIVRIEEGAIKLRLTFPPTLIRKQVAIGPFRNRLAVTEDLVFEVQRDHDQQVGYVIFNGEGKSPAELKRLLNVQAKSQNSIRMLCFGIGKEALGDKSQYSVKLE
jgi:hypothetical protein